MPCAQKLANDSKAAPAAYTPADDLLVLEKLLEEKTAGLLSDNGFKKAVWERVCTTLAETHSGGGENLKTVTSVKARYQRDFFRTLVKTSKPSSSSSKSTGTRAALLPPKKTASSSTKGSSEQAASNDKSAFKPRKIDNKFRDRAAERRAGINDYAQVEGLLEDFEKRNAELDRETLEEQRKMLGGDEEHTILVKGLDIALLEQNKARAAADEDEEADAALEAALRGSPPPPKPATPPIVSSSGPSKPIKSREERIADLKRKRDAARGAQPQPASGPSREEVEKLERAKSAGKFRPIGAPVPSAPAAAGEEKRKKKKRKVTIQEPSPSATTSVSAKATATPLQSQSAAVPAPTASSSTKSSDTPSMTSKPPSPPALAPPPSTSTAPTPTSKSPTRPLPVPAPTNDDSDEDIFAGAGTYSGLASGSDSDSDSNSDSGSEEGERRSKRRAEKAPARDRDIDGDGDTKMGEPQAGKWFGENDPDLEGLLGKPKIDAPAAVKPSSSTRPRTRSPSAHRGPPSDAGSEEEGEVARPPTRLQPLSSSAFPSVKHLLDADAEAEAEEKRKARKAKYKSTSGGMGPGLNHLGEVVDKDEGGKKGKGKGKMDKDQKLNREYQQYVSYTEKKGKNKSGDS